LIWNSLKVTTSNPNHPFYDIVIRTNSSRIAITTTSYSSSGTVISDETLQSDTGKPEGNFLTLYLQRGSLNDAKSNITKRIFPHLGRTSCSERRNTIQIPKLPIDEYPNDDPYIPWIHDYHINYPVASEVRFIAQNKRRCYTGIRMESQMKYWEPQMAMFQSISILAEESIENKQKRYRLTW
jgi:hypothetical protein